MINLELTEQELRVLIKALENRIDVISRKPIAEGDYRFEASLKIRLEKTINRFQWRQND